MAYSTSSTITSATSMIRTAFEDDPSIRSSKHYQDNYNDQTTCDQGTYEGTFGDEHTLPRDETSPVARLKQLLLCHSLWCLFLNEEYTKNKGGGASASFLSLEGSAPSKCKHEHNKGEVTWLGLTFSREDSAEAHRRSLLEQGTGKSTNQAGRMEGKESPEKAPATITVAKVTTLDKYIPSHDPAFKVEDDVNSEVSLDFPEPQEVVRGQRIQIKKKHPKMINTKVDEENSGIENGKSTRNCSNTTPKVLPRDEEKNRTDEKKEAAASTTHQAREQGNLEFANNKHSKNLQLLRHEMDWNEPIDESKTTTTPIIEDLKDGSTIKAPNRHQIKVSEKKGGKESFKQSLKVWGSLLDTQTKKRQKENEEQVKSCESKVNYSLMSLDVKGRLVGCTRKHQNAEKKAEVKKVQAASDTKLTEPERCPGNNAKIMAVDECDDLSVLLNPKFIPDFSRRELKLRPANSPPEQLRWKYAEDSTWEYYGDPRRNRVDFWWKQEENSKDSQGDKNSAHDHKIVLNKLNADNACKTESDDRYAVGPSLVDADEGENADKLGVEYKMDQLEDSVFWKVAKAFNPGSKLDSEDELDDFAQVKDLRRHRCSRDDTPYDLATIFTSAHKKEITPVPWGGFRL